MRLLMKSYGGRRGGRGIVLGLGLGLGLGVRVRVSHRNIFRYQIPCMNFFPKIVAGRFNTRHNR